MNEFGLPATAEALNYLRRIAAAMTDQFGVEPAEAVGRVSGFWRGESFLTDDAVGALLHQGTRHWANTVYYGDRDWWRDDAPRVPAPYPRP